MTNILENKIDLDLNLNDFNKKIKDLINMSNTQDWKDDYINYFSAKN